jgi:hypothetical protein
MPRIPDRTVAGRQLPEPNAARSRQLVVRLRSRRPTEPEGAGPPRRLPRSPRRARCPGHPARPPARRSGSPGVDGGSVAAVLADQPYQHPAQHAALLPSSRRRIPDPPSRTAAVGCTDRPARRRHVSQPRRGRYQARPATDTGHLAPHPRHTAGRAQRRGPRGLALRQPRPATSSCPVRAARTPRCGPISGSPPGASRASDRSSRSGPRSSWPRSSPPSPTTRSIRCGD